MTITSERPIAVTAAAPAINYRLAVQGLIDRGSYRFPVSSPDVIYLGAELSTNALDPDVASLLRAWEGKTALVGELTPPVGDPRGQVIQRYTVECGINFDPQTGKYEWHPYTAPEAIAARAGA